jgi:hypothetical protein
MNNINTGIEPVQEGAPPTTKIGILSKISDKIPPKVKAVFAKFYTNKKIFWPVTISLGLLLLVVILGLLFGTEAPPSLPTPSPTVFVVSTPEASPSGDILSVTERQLRDLRNQINSLDLNQSHLAPPQINYDIKF